MTRDVDNVVDPTSDPVVPFTITSGSVTSELWRSASLQPKGDRGLNYVISWVQIKVCIHVSLMCTPDCARHTGPRLLERQNPLNIVSVNLFARDRIDNRRLDTKERKGCTTWLGGRNSSKRSDDIRPRLRLPVSLEPVSIHFKWKSAVAHVYNMGFLLSNNLEVPFPNLRSNWLSH